MVGTSKKAVLRFIDRGPEKLLERLTVNTPDGIFWQFSISEP
jgi:hypothetical protein